MTREQLILLLSSSTNIAVSDPSEIDLFAVADEILAAMAPDYKATYYIGADLRHHIHVDLPDLLEYDYEYIFIHNSLTARCASQDLRHVDESGKLWEVEVAIRVKEKV